MAYGEVSFEAQYWVSILMFPAELKIRKYAELINPASSEIAGFPLSFQPGLRARNLSQMADALPLVVELFRMLATAEE